MPIYQKGTSSFTTVKDIYLCTGANAFSRICKVYLCTAANTFSLVYDGCAVTCDCTCENCPFVCNFHATARDPDGFTQGCECALNPSEPWQIYRDAVDEEGNKISGWTFTPGCYTNPEYCCPPGGFPCPSPRLCYEKCCVGAFTNCAAYNNAKEGANCCSFECQ